MAIKLIHAEHGRHVAGNSLEADECVKNGWQIVDAWPAKQVSVGDTPEPVKVKRPYTKKAKQ